jgi:cell division initiation protein
MISSEDVRHVTFDKAFQGYRREDVDDYLKQVAQAMDDLAAQNDDLQKKLVMLAQRIEKYRTMENSLSTSMINAQRMGDSIIRESKQKAAEIIRSANIKAEDREQRARDDVELAKQEIVTLKGEADSFKRSLIEMYRKHINLINKLPDYTRRPEDEPVPPPSPAPEQAAAPAAEPQPAVQAPVYTAPAVAQPVPESAPVQQAAQMPAMQETAYYEPPTAQPVPEPTESARAQGEKVDTVEFAIAPHPEEPEEAEPAPIPVEEPAIDETRLQDVSGLYDEPEAKPARRRKAGTTRRTTRKKASGEPQEELNSPAFDNFEGVDFDS